jgi:hypothetical protein
MKGHFAITLFAYHSGEKSGDAVEWRRLCACSKAAQGKALLCSKHAGRYPQTTLAPIHDFVAVADRLRRDRRIDSGSA